MKNWNWSLFKLVYVLSAIGIFANENITSIWQGLIVGNILGLILGLLMAWGYKK